MRWVTPIPYTEFSLCSFGKSAINEIGRAETPPETDTSLERLREEGRGCGCGRRMNELQELEVFQSFFLPFAFYRRCEGEKAESCRTWARLAWTGDLISMHRVAWTSPLYFCCVFSQRRSHLASFLMLIYLHFIRGPHKQAKPSQK